MNPTKRIPLLAVALAGSLLAGTPVAKLVATDGVLVKGVALPTTTQLAYPVSLNDEIATTKAKPATLEFSDGSKVTVQAGSTIRLEQSKHGVALRVLKGNVEYRLTSKSNLEILSASGKKIGGGVDTRSIQALAMASQPASIRRTSSNSSQFNTSDANSLVANAYMVGHADAASATTSIVLPNGFTLIVTPTSSGAYTITSIVVPVTTPGGSTTLTATSGPLIGATLTPSTGGGSSASITLPGQTTPLTPAQISSQLSTTATQAVTAATQSGQLPPGSAPTPPGAPVSIPNPPAPPPPPPVLTSPQ